MYVAVKTISMSFALYLGAYNIWPAIQKGEQVIVVLAVAGLIIFTGLLYTGFTANWNSKKPKPYSGQDTNESLVRPIPYTFNHNGRRYDTSKAKFLGGFNQMGADYRAYTYHVDMDTKDAFRIEWDRVRGAGMLYSVYQTPEKHYGGYDVWYDGTHGYQHAIEDVYDRCGIEAADVVEERLEALSDKKFKPDISSKTLGGGAVWI